MRENYSKFRASLINLLRRLSFGCFKLFDPRKMGVVYFISPNDSPNKVKEIKRRYHYFFPKMKFRSLKYKEGKYNFYFSTMCPLPIVISDSTYFYSRFKSLFSRNGVFDVDFEKNPQDGWEWHRLLNYVPEKKYENEIGDSFKRFKVMKRRLLSLGKKKVYVFGTGLSLERAKSKRWDDGYNVVCNTIVRDKSLYEHIFPDIVVAGDAIYHFGFTQFATQFRKDLRKRLSETPTYFIYPYLFHEFVCKEFSMFEDRLIPIPIGNHKKIYNDLSRRFELPNLGNVLSLLLLPLACNLSKKVFLWGFDGRAPGDKRFWANSPKHTYADLVEEIEKAHPAFVDHYMPNNKDPNKYVRMVHGDELDRCLKIAERRGWRFTMMHKTWTKTLAKRYRVTNTEGGGDVSKE